MAAQHRIHSELRVALEPSRGELARTFVREACLCEDVPQGTATSLAQLIATARLPGSGIGDCRVGLDGAKPRDEVEAGLAMKIACCHSACPYRKPYTVGE